MKRLIVIGVLLLLSYIVIGQTKQDTVKNTVFDDNFGKKYPIFIEGGRYFVILIHPTKNKTKKQYLTKEFVKTLMRKNDIQEVIK